MKYHKLGKTGLEVSELSFGAAPLGDMYGDTSIENAKITVATAIDAGINYFDVAPSYGPEGRAEERLGLALDGKRNQIYLATKLGRYDHGTVEKPDYEFAYDAKRVRLEVENSLRRLRTDYIDIYQVHDVHSVDHLDIIVNETIPEMVKLKKEGKIRFIGVTGIFIDTLKYLIEKSDDIDTVLNFCRYNLIDTTLKGAFESEIDRGIGLVNASILYMGILTDTAKALTSYPKTPEYLSLMESAQKASALCKSRGTSLAEQSYLFGMDYNEAASTLVGIGRMSSLTRNLKMLGQKPDYELCAEVMKIFDGVNFFPHKGHENGVTIKF